MSRQIDLVLAGRQIDLIPMGSQIYLVARGRQIDMIVMGRLIVVIAMGRQIDQIVMCKQIDRIAVIRSLQPVLEHFFVFISCLLVLKDRDIMLASWMTTYVRLRIQIVLAFSINHLKHCTRLCISHVKRRTIMFLFFSRP